MNSIRNLILIACFVAIAISIVDMLYPSKNFTKQMRFLFSLVFIIGVITPIVSGKIEFSFPVSAQVMKNSNYINVEDNIFDSYKKNISKNIQQELYTILQKNNIKPKEININININQDKSISITNIEIIVGQNVDSSYLSQLIFDEIGVTPTIKVEDENA